MRKGKKMPKSTELIAEETRELRLQLKALIDSGIPKQKALVKLFPNDSNRARKLKLWEKEGLFPIPEAELKAFERTGATAEELQTVAPEAPITVAPDTTVIEEIDIQDDEIESAYIEETPVLEPQKATELETVAPDTTVLEKPVGGLDQENLLRLIDQRAGEVVENRLKGMVADLHVAEKAPGGAGRGHKGKTHTKFNISIPSELNEALEALGGVKSQHIAHAIRLYLELINKQ
jgi:hypothetical protein